MRLNLPMAVCKYSIADIRHASVFQQPTNRNDPVNDINICIQLKTPSMIIICKVDLLIFLPESFCHNPNNHLFQLSHSPIPSYSVCAALFWALAYYSHRWNHGNAAYSIRSSTVTPQTLFYPGNHICSKKMKIKTLPKPQHLPIGLPIGGSIQYLRLIHLIHSGRLLVLTRIGTRCTRTKCCLIIVDAIWIIMNIQYVWIIWTTLGWRAKKSCALLL